MNRMVRLSPDPQANELDRLQDSLSYHERAKRIVERVLPHLPTPNPLYDAEGFREASRRHGERERLYWRTFARLRAKAEGGAPYLMLPKDCPALEGGAMTEIARSLLTDAELHAHANAQRKFGRDGL